MADDDLITDDELYEHYSFKAGKGQEPLRVDKFLMNFVENASRNKVQQAAKVFQGKERETALFGNP